MSVQKCFSILSHITSITYTGIKRTKENGRVRKRAALPRCNRGEREMFNPSLGHQLRLSEIRQWLFERQYGGGTTPMSAKKFPLCDIEMSQFQKKKNDKRECRRIKKMF